MKRRNFLRSTLAGLSLAAVTGPVAAGQSSTSDRRRIKIGFFGASHSHGSEKVRIAKESKDYELIGVVEPSEAVRRRMGSLGVNFITKDQLLAQSELVAVESDVKDHAWQAKTALEAGKQVHLEKPPSDNMKEFRELVALAAQKKRLLQMGYMWRFHPGINAALDAARNGWLGEIYRVRGTINTSISDDRRPEWGQFRGGTMFELGGHLIDPLIRLMGKPEKVSPFLKTHSKLDDGFADDTLVVFEFARAIGTVSSATMQPGAGNHRSFEILGTNGTALVKPIEPPKLEIHLDKAAGPYKAGFQTVPMPSYRRYVAEFIEMAECIRSGRPLSVTPEEDLIVHEALLRASGMHS